MSQLLHTLSHIKRRRHLVPLATAVRLAWSERGHGKTQIYLKPLHRCVSIRIGTSDLACFEQVFLRGEYNMPYDIEPAIIIDAGANVGAATLFFSHRYPGARIFAIEPEATNFEMLKHNCGGLRNVTLIEAALWSRHAHLSVIAAGREKFAASVTECESDGPQVKAITIDDLMAAYGLSRIDYLKMDIEGAEKEIFADNPPWLDKVEVLAVELHDRFKAGCAHAFYSALVKRPFRQEIQGEIAAIRLLPAVS
jgi:FkbM family methyltransferase